MQRPVFRTFNFKPAQVAKYISLYSPLQNLLHFPPVTGGGFVVFVQLQQLSPG